MRYDDDYFPGRYGGWAVLDRWAVTATTGDAAFPRGKILAAPARAATGDGSVAVEIAVAAGQP